MTYPDPPDDAIELDLIPRNTMTIAANAILDDAARRLDLGEHPQVVDAMNHAATLLILIHRLGGPNLEPTMRTTEAWDRLGDLVADVPLVVALGYGDGPLALLPVVDVDVWTSAAGAGPMVRLITGGGS